MLDAAKLIIPGRPATKKNSSRVVKRGNFTKVLPSKAFEEYQRVALVHVRAAMLSQFTGPVTLRCLYWMQDRRAWPDLVGLLQATSDILEASSVLENDRLIVNYDGSCIVGIDKYNPRAEIYIRALGAGYISPDPYVEKNRRRAYFERSEQDAKSDRQRCKGYGAAHRWHQQP